MYLETEMCLDEVEWNLFSVWLVDFSKKMENNFCNMINNIILVIFRNILLF